jgi:hypothetical protein
MIGRKLGVALVVLLAVGAGACSGGDDRSSAGDAGEEANASPNVAAASLSADEDGATAGGAGGSDGGELVGALPAGVAGERVVKTASLEVEVASGDFAAAFSKVPTIAAAHGGFVASSSSMEGTEEGRQAAGTLVVRVPSENFDAARQQLVDLGDLQSQQLKGDDVGGQLADLDARLRNLRSHEEAIRLLMTKTGTIGETIEVQRQLSTVREQIEQLAAQQARLNDAVAYATITLSLAEPGVAFNPKGDGSPLGDAFGRALDGAENVLAAVIVTLGYLVPLGLLAGAVFLVARPFLARRRPATAAPAP